MWMRQSVSCLRLIFGCALIVLGATRTSGASLGIVGYGRTLFDQVDTNLAPAVNQAGDVLQVSESTSSGLTHPSQVSYSGKATFGYLGVAFAASDYCSGIPGDQCGYVDGLLRVTSHDYLTFSGINEGTLAMDFLFEGNVGGLSPSFLLGLMEYAVFGAGDAQLRISLADPQVIDAVHSGFGVSAESLTPIVGSPDYFYYLRGTALVPFAGGSLTLSQSLLGQWNCNGATGCWVGMDFLHSARVGSARILDVDGNVVSGATFASESGYDYTRPISDPDSSVPEPSYSIGVASGLIFLGAVRYRRRRAR
jgi:hypothetical protein